MTIFVSAATAALATNLSITAIYQHIREKNLPASKVQGFKEWMITKQDLQYFIAERAKGNYTRQLHQARHTGNRVMETCNGSKILTVPAGAKD